MSGAETVLILFVCICMLLNSWMASANYYSARKNREFFESYLREKYGDDWRKLFDMLPPEPSMFEKIQRAIRVR